MATIKNFLKLNQSSLVGKTQFTTIVNIAKICGIPVAEVAGETDTWIDEYYGQIIGLLMMVGQIGMELNILHMWMNLTK